MEDLMPQIWSLIDTYKRHEAEWCGLQLYLTGISG
jgi:hypothetical protein